MDLAAKISRPKADSKYQLIKYLILIHSVETNDDACNGRGQLDEIEKIPMNLFSRSMVEANTINTYPMTMNAAIKYVATIITIV